ncbi:NAD-dependent epimerase/dehydratase family protein [Ramlibacter sp.]|uniref:NAD-dependent epimerase/dehydratase family protein n=1 Tax=Ramlibacter sp. TaxID=1917967 RepID=UPI003D0E99F6
MTVVVTGANGFVGSALVRALHAAGVPLRACTRVAQRSGPVESVGMGELQDLGNWAPLLQGAQCVVHTAAVVHRPGAPAEAYFRVNTDATLHLANLAVAAGVKRFVFVSTVKVNGESSAPGRPLTEADVAAPTDPYGLSKLKAEEGLRQLVAGTGMDFVAVRPPLVYGPGVGGNFAQMMKWVARGVPLPLGSARGNRRTLVALDNLVDLLVTCIRHPAAANEVFFAGDAEGLSTAELVERLALAMGKRARLVPMPPSLLMAAAKIVGRPGIAQRLLGNLQLDIGKAADRLGWRPPLGVDEGLRRAAAAHRSGTTV